MQPPVGWVLVHPEITPPDNFYHFRDTTLDLDEDRDFETVAGLVLDEVGQLPEVGQRIDLQGWGVEVVDMDGRRIDKLLVQKAAA